MVVNAIAKMMKVFMLILYNYKVKLNKKSYVKKIQVSLILN